MILDLSQRPLLVLHEQCPKSIVVRTFETKDATGLISVKREHRLQRRVFNQPLEKTAFLTPGASLKRGNVTCHETRLDLLEASRAYEAVNASQPRWNRVGPDEKPKVDLSADPFEVATGAKDAITDQLFTWRAAIFIQRRKDLWLVTVRDISGEKMVDLCTVGVRDLDSRPSLTEDLPLLRLTKTVIGKPQNAWEHLLADDE